ncbi:hypothetical protein D9615_000706 [Tricholomella constricta]|uniref:Uncharacterized protein n=1 Tax=Tricholomella constricta TaxID=117010 RepID=A0A8H5HRR6_9AGAR|nr:hypothetical protein D9615_000706 [Tricholomella constricta]
MHHHDAYPALHYHPPHKRPPMVHTAAAMRSSHPRRLSISEFSNMSVVSLRATSLDVCEYVYGDSVASMDAITRFYEPNASYENPVLTATSRSVIADIHRLSQQLSSVDVPRPLAMFCTLFRLRLPERAQNADPLFHGLRVWTEMGDVCENETFDGHRKTIVEHTLNILLLPGIHCQGHRPQSSTDSLVSTSASPISSPHHPISPSLRIPGTSVLVPSPLHFQLHVVTRLSFNEQGRVAHHRDFWDIKDVIGLVPGVSLAQWVGTRLAALGLSYLSKFWMREKSHSVAQQAVAVAEPPDLEGGASPVTAYFPSTKNALGLEGV